jgi:membrane protease YdiL (CAAX protease family)
MEHTNMTADKKAKRDFLILNAAKRMFRELTFTRLLNALIIAYMMIAALHNTISQQTACPPEIERGVGFVGQILILTLLTLIAADVWKGGRRYNCWGFTLNGKIWHNVSLIIISSILLFPRYPLFTSFGDSLTAWKIAAASLEEIVFRVYLISLFLRIAKSHRRRLFIAMSLSAVAFTLIHIPTKSVFELLNIFVGSMIFGYVAYHTKSVLFPIYIHVLMNTGGDVGFIGAGYAVIAYFCVALLAFVKNHRKSLRYFT